MTAAIVRPFDPFATCARCGAFSYSHDHADTYLPDAMRCPGFTLTIEKKRTARGGNHGN